MILAPNYLSHIERYCEHNDFVYSDYTEIDAQGSYLAYQLARIFSQRDYGKGDFLATEHVLERLLLNQ